MDKRTDDRLGYGFIGFVLGVWFTACVGMCAAPAEAQGLFDSTTVQYGGIEYTTIWADGEQIFITRQQIGGLSVTDITDGGESYGVAYSYDYQLSPLVTSSQGFTLGESPTVGLFTVLEMQRIEGRQRLQRDGELFECQVCKPREWRFNNETGRGAWEVKDDDNPD